MRRVFSKQGWAAKGAVSALLALGILPGAVQAAAPSVLYNFGDPSADEQYMLELINRARANPPAEADFLVSLSDSNAAVRQAVEFFFTSDPGVRPENLRPAFASYSPKPPFAWNARLRSSARAQALDQANRNYQGHLFPPSLDPNLNATAYRNRIEFTYQYDWATCTENVYASQDVVGGYYRVTGVDHTHAAFFIDWGVLPTRFHREALLSLVTFSDYREVGFGIVETSRSTPSARAYAIAQDFGTERGETRDVPFLTGVVYFDANQNFFYDVGENQSAGGALSGGITVMPEHGRYYTVTSAAGGYSLPLLDLPTGTTTLRVTFSGGGLRQSFTRDVVLAGTANRKLDLRVPVEGASRLANLSTRLRVEDGEARGIAGFVVTGDRPKRVLIRALGPTLQPFGIPNPLPDPRIELKNQFGQQIASNDNWAESQRAEIEATSFAPPNAVEPALIATLVPGSYTAIISGTESAPAGVAIIEVYDLDSTSADARAINVSTRGKVLDSYEVMIGGFVIDGTQPRQVVVRALGPTLTAFGVTGALQDPLLELFRITPTGNELVRVNDSWRNDSGQSTLASKGLAPPDDREPAMVVNLAPGSYTAVVKGVGGSKGIGIVEVYDVP